MDASLLKRSNAYGRPAVLQNDQVGSGCHPKTECNRKAACKDALSLYVQGNLYVDMPILHCLSELWKKPFQSFLVLARFYLAAVVFLDQLITLPRCIAPRNLTLLIQFSITRLSFSQYSTILGFVYGAPLKLAQTIYTTCLWQAVIVDRVSLGTLSFPGSMTFREEDIYAYFMMGFFCSCFTVSRSRGSLFVWSAFEPTGLRPCYHICEVIKDSSLVVIAPEGRPILTSHLQCTGF
ncbi:hypothetical protein GALMADRAFT_1224937 [Galerina marginata CBS 339.88]|uniref:Uncharacterized protein n=1 Tax=Galerina marginata (strain CBS 339.88) TaxID=685588 RepID=A0A067T7N4_GALM3|nr:hypothetical protein GALMADRAFT_1224937 [Galerina marginata CBS 339.88]